MAAKIEDFKASENHTCNFEHFIPVPLCCQETEYTCGVACVQSILASYGILYRQDTLIELLKQKPIYGTDAHNIIFLMEMLGFEASIHIDMNIGILKEYIDKKIPPLLLIQAWKDDNIDYFYDWKDSHYVIACGYDEERIIFMDPYTLGNYTYIPNNELLKRWHSVDEVGNHCFNTGLIIKNDNLRLIYDPHSIKKQG